MPPTTKFSLIQELIHRDGLRPALAGRDDVLLEPILRLLLKYITDPRFGELSCDVGRIIIGTFMFADTQRMKVTLVTDMYIPVFGHSPLIDGLLLQLRRKVEAELKFQNELTQVRGALDMILSTSILSTVIPSSSPSF